MITYEKNDWRVLLANAVTQPAELLEMLNLNSDGIGDINEVIKHFPLRVPRGFVARMKKSDPDDPLLRQVLPLGIERDITSGFSTDPLQEMNKNPLPGLLHKFHGRVLFIVTGGCAINCRYCFRQHFPYSANNPGRRGWKQIFEYINNDSTISEVILSGGDPLLATDMILNDLVQQLEAIPHVRRLRIHSRIPIILPERISAELLTWLGRTRLKTTLVTHCNHAQEINADVAEAMQKLAQIGVTLLNQAVLLKGVNNNAQALVGLSEALFDCGILPYYLFALDKVQGAAHFDIPLKQAQFLHQEMTRLLPGYLVPRLARELPGAPAKVLISQHDES